ncbi:unnamed protein product, partial [Ectocarpus sp. 12 AP-2014]
SDLFPKKWLANRTCANAYCCTFPSIVKTTCGTWSGHGIPPIQAVGSLCGKWPLNDKRRMLRSCEMKWNERPRPRHPPSPPPRLGKTAVPPYGDTKQLDTSSSSVSRRSNTMVVDIM